MKNDKLISTNCLKAISIIFVVFLHSIQANDNVNLSEVYAKGFFDFWVHQAVPIFVVITGFHYAISIEKVGNVLYWYNKDVFAKKVLRIIVPFGIVHLAYCAYFLLSNNINFSWKIFEDLFLLFLRGGAGPGGYYTSIMAQILIIFPIIFFLIKKYHLVGIIALVGINIIYELMVKNEVFSNSFYRLCCIRLLSGFAIGAALAVFYNEIKKTLLPIILFLAGSLFIVAYSFGGYKSNIISGWVMNSYAAMPYAAGIVFCSVFSEAYFLKIKEKFYHAVCVIEFIGKSSYHILLFQQFWYCLRFTFRDDMRVRYACLIDIGICLICGVLFYYLNNCINCLFRNLKKLLCNKSSVEIVAKK